MFTTSADDQNNLRRIIRLHKDNKSLQLGNERYAIRIDEKLAASIIRSSLPKHVLEFVKGKIGENACIVGIKLLCQKRPKEQPVHRDVDNGYNLSVGILMDVENRKLETILLTDDHTRIETHTNGLAFDGHMLHAGPAHSPSRKSRILIDIADPAHECFAVNWKISGVPLRKCYPSLFGDRLVARVQFKEKANGAKAMFTRVTRSQSTMFGR